MARPGRTLAMIPMLVFVVVAARVGLCSASAKPARGRSVVQTEALPGRALVYARPQALSAQFLAPWEVVWWPGRGPSQMIYRSQRPGTMLGLLPSPDGRWLCVWETPEGGSRTVWTAVELRTGRQAEILAETGPPGYLPFWHGASELHLERGATEVVWEATAGKARAGLTTRPVAGKAREYDVAGETAEAIRWREEYLRRHFANDVRALGRALADLPKVLAVGDYLRPPGGMKPDRPSDLLLRPMGVVDRAGHQGMKAPWPGVAFSPDGTRVARTAVVRVGVASVVTLKGDTWREGTFESRVDVYEGRSGRRLWGMSVPWVQTLGPDRAPMHNPRGGWGDAWFGEVRWSRDGRYLSVGWRTATSVVDTWSWREVLRVPQAENLFIIANPR
jgi:hypothetical protein